MLATSRSLWAVLDFHRKGQTVPHVETEDLCLTKAADEREELDYGFPQPKFCGSIIGVGFRSPKLQKVHGRRPRVEYQLASIDEQRLNAIEPELVKSRKETTLRWLQIRARHRTSCFLGNRSTERSHIDSFLEQKRALLDRSACLGVLWIPIG